MANSENTKNYEEISVNKTETNSESVSGGTYQRDDEKAATSKQSKETENRLNLGASNDLQPIDFNSADTVRQTVKTIFGSKVPSPYSENIWRVHNNSESSILMEVDSDSGNHSKFENDETKRYEEPVQRIVKEATTSQAQPLNLDSNYKADNMNDFRPFHFNSADIVRQAMEVFSHKILPSHSRNAGQGKSDLKNGAHMTIRRSVPMINPDKGVRQSTVGKRFRNSKKKRARPRKPISPRRRRKIIFSMYGGKLSNFIPFT